MISARQRRLEPRRQAGVAVMEDRRDQHQRLEQQHRGERHVEERRSPRARTSADSSTSPKWKRSALVVSSSSSRWCTSWKRQRNRDLVVGAVPPVDPEVEQHEVEQQAGPAAPPGRPQAEAEARRPDRDRQHDQRREQKIDAEQAEIAGQPPPGRRARAAERAPAAGSRRPAAAARRRGKARTRRRPATALSASRVSIVMASSTIWRARPGRPSRRRRSGC